MPVKRRNLKRRVDAEAEYRVWSDIFDTGYDFFDELPQIGLRRQRPGQVDPELAREPWARLGKRWLAEHSDEARITWAEEQYGRPWEVDDAA